MPPMFPVSRTTHAVILAGGSGSRMPPLPTPDMPKSLLPIANVPMLYYPLLSLLRTGITTGTILADPAHHASITTLLAKLPASPPHNFTVYARTPGLGTADALRALTLPACVVDLLILSCDSLTDADFAPLLRAHCASHASFTAAFLPAAPAPPLPKSKKTVPKSKSPSPTLYVVHTPIDNRLLAVSTPADLSSGTLRIPPALLSHHPTLHLRADLSDPHIYVIHRPLLTALLEAYPAISSLKYDLLPYLTRRQHTLSRRARTHAWPLPADKLCVHAFFLDQATYAVRSNTVHSFLRANLDVAAGKLDCALSPVKPSSHAVPKKKNILPLAKQAQSAFKEAGERVSVTQDSRVGAECVAGDRVSVKKSVVGDCCVLRANVKVTSSVVMSDVTIDEAANLSACVVCPGAIVGKKCVLKDCCIAAGVSVPDSTVESGRDFLPSSGESDTEDVGFEFV